jgi:hypothetical protein
MMFDRIEDCVGVEIAPGVEPLTVPHRVTDGPWAGKWTCLARTGCGLSVIEVRITESKRPDCHCDALPITHKHTGIYLGGGPQEERP